jgi:fibronectin-binding autotransporter adhesin
MMRWSLSPLIDSNRLRRSLHALFLSFAWLTLWLFPPFARGQLLVSFDGSPGSVNSYNPTTGAVTQSPFATLERPFAISSDASHVFITSYNGSNGSIAEYTFGGAVVNAALVSGLAGPYGIAVAGGEIYEVNQADQTIESFSTLTGLPNPAFTTIDIAGASPSGIAVLGGFLYVVEQANNEVSEWDLTGASISRTFINSGGTTIAGFGNDLYLTSGDGVAEYNATTGVAINPNLITGLSGPFGVSLSPDGSIVYVTDNSAGTVGSYNAVTGAAINASLITELVSPLGIYAGLAGPPPGIYWDIPVGGPSGTWDTTSAFWSASSAGGSQVAWVNGSDAVFSADDLAATGNFTVTLGESLNVGNLTYRGGNAGSTLDIAVGAGDTITMANPTMNVTVDPDTTLVIEPVIAGAGKLVLESGTLVLTGANTYTGGTTITAGTLQIGNGGITGSIVGDVIDNGNLAFDRSDAVIFAGDISGTGSLTKLGAGTLTLSGANTYSGTTTVTTGTLQAASTTAFSANSAFIVNVNDTLDLNGFSNSVGSLAGNGTVINNGSALAILTAGDDNSSTIFSGNLTNGIGTLGLTKTGTGLMNLTGKSSYTGGTVVDQGILQISGTGGIFGTVTNNAFLDFNSASADGITLITNNAGGHTQFEGTSMASTASIDNIGSGFTLFSDTSNAGTAQITNQGGQTNFAGTSSAGNATITTNSGGATNFTFSSTAGDATLITNNFGVTNFRANSTAASAAITTDAGGFTKFFDTSTAGGATITNAAAGETDFNDSSSAGTSTITNTNTGETHFTDTSTAGNATITSHSGGSTLFFDTSTGGNARFITEAGGVFDISSLTSTGMTVGSIEGGGTYNLGSKALTVGSNNVSTEVTGTINDGGLVNDVGGSLVKVGTGTLTLSGVNTYTGGTTIEEGVISVAQDLNLGASGGITLEGGELLTTLDGFGSARLVTLNPIVPGNTLAAAAGTTATYTGIISGLGALTVGDATHTGTVVLASGANNYTDGTTVTGGAALSVDRDAELGGTGPGGGITLQGGKLVVSMDGFSTNRTLTLDLGANTLAAPDANFDRNVTFSGLVTGSGGLIVGDANSSSLSVTLTNPINAYAGGTVIAGGATLEVDTDTELGNLSGGITLSGGTLQTTADGFTSARPITLMPSVIANTLATGFFDTAIYSGLISGTGGLTIGGGTVVLTHANTYSGGTTVASATVSVSSDANLGDLNGGITLMGGEILSTVDGFVSARPIFLINGGDFQNVLAATTLNKGTYTGLISGAGGLTIGDNNNDEGIVVLAGQNTYLGNTTVTGAATLSVSADANLGDPGNGSVLQNGKLLTTAENFITPRAITLGTAGGNDTLAAASGTVANYSGIISGSGGILAIGDGANNGTIVLSGNNTYDGGTDIFPASSSQRAPTPWGPQGRPSCSAVL